MFFIEKFVKIYKKEKLLIEFLKKSLDLNEERRNDAD